MAGSVIVVGGGIFGVTAALALARRGHERVTLVEPGPLPHPLAESTDISKVVRMDYGADTLYAAWMEDALDGWRRWNARWPEPLYHETGVMFVCRAPMAKGGFEHDCYEVLTARGHHLDRLDAETLKARFPAWSTGRYIDGYFNPIGGYARSGAVVAQLARDARDIGVTIIEGATVSGLIERGARVLGVTLGDGTTLHADEIVIAAGAWTPSLVPELAGALQAVGQPVFHLAPPDPALFAFERFPVFGADISRTGYYGFPATRDGIVKIANHGVGRAMHPDSAARVVTPDETAAFRAFLADTFPALADAPLVYTRVCVYCDTADGHFLIARHPDRAGLTIATGGSGHAFKFAPLVGDWIADAVEDRPLHPRFRYRTDPASGPTEEAARHQSDR